MSETIANSSSSLKEFPYAPSAWNCLSEVNRRWLEELDPIVERFVWRLKRRELQGSTTVALQTTELLRTFLTKAPVTLNIGEVTNLIRQLGKVLTSARPNDLVVGNVVRRVLFVLRHACASFKRLESDSGSKKLQVKEGDSSTSEASQVQSSPSSALSLTSSGSMNATSVDMSVSIHNLFVSSSVWDETVSFSHLKPLVLQDSKDLAVEITTAKDEIADQASEHLFGGDVILTAGYSSAVLEFLVAGAALTSFTVFVLESAPGLVGQRMAAELARHKINVTLLSDAAMVAIMPSVTKVLVGSQAVMADGGILAPAGYAALCLAAKRYAKPVVVLAGIHKVSPLYAFDQTTFNELTNPAQVLSYDAIANDYEGLVDVVSPVFDYVTPESISLYVTNFGCYQPSYIYRLLSEYYNVYDYSL